MLVGKLAKNGVAGREPNPLSHAATHVSYPSSYRMEDTGFDSTVKSMKELGAHQML